MLKREDYYTTDGGKPAPHSGMTDDDLEDFERWAARVDGDYSGASVIVVVVCVVLVVIALVFGG